MKARLLFPILLAAVSLAASLHAHAQDQDQRGMEENLRRLNKLDKQVHEMRDAYQRALKTGDPVVLPPADPEPEVTALRTKIDDLSQSLRQLTGQMEVLSHTLDLIKKDDAAVHAQTNALAERLDKLEKQVTVLATPPPPPPPPPPPTISAPTPAPLTGGQGAPGPLGADTAESKAAYARARQLMLDGDYPAAATAFQGYITTFGDTPSAAPARYWLGEIKYSQTDFAGAATAFIGAIRGWPQTAWAPDAVVKLALSLVELKKSPDACGMLTEFARRYPKAPPATKARAAAARAKASCGA